MLADDTSVRPPELVLAKAVGTLPRMPAAVAAMPTLPRNLRRLDETCEPACCALVLPATGSTVAQSWGVLFTTSSLQRCNNGRALCIFPSKAAGQRTQRARGQRTACSTCFYFSEARMRTPRRTHIDAAHICRMLLF